MSIKFFACLTLAGAIALSGPVAAGSTNMPAKPVLHLADAGKATAKKPRGQLKLKAPGSGPLKDEQCGPGHVPCDDDFVRFCTEILGGTMSGEQEWGGKTCFEPT